MTIKDWMLLLVPIVANLVVDGFLIVLLDKFLIDRFVKRRVFKDEIVKEFMNKLKAFSDCMMQANFDAMIDGDSVNENVPIMQSFMVDLTKYYNTNIYDLNQFKIKYDALTNHWMIFQNTLNAYALQEDLTANMRIDLGKKIQLVFDSLSDLIECVRKKY